MSRGSASGTARGPLRRALERDLKPLKNSETLRGRDAAVERARILADAMDTARGSGVLPQIDARFRDALNALGLGELDVVADADPFAEFLADLGSDDGTG